MLESNKWYVKKKNLDQGKVDGECREVGVE